MKETFPGIDQYVEDVLSKIHHPGLRSEIARELRGHLTESIQSEIDGGLPEEQAIRAALSKMGEPSGVGAQLAEVHRPRIEGWLLAPALTLLLLGWFAMYENGRIAGQLIFGLLGVALGAVLTFTDYSKLKKFALPTFVATAATLLLALACDTKYEGEAYLFLGPLRIKLMDACPFLFTIALAGMMSKAAWEKRKNAWLLLGAILVAQALLLAGGSFPALLLFLAAATTVMHCSSARHWQTALIGVTGIAMSIALWSPGAFVALDAAAASRVSESHTDYVFCYLLCTFGKATAALAVVAAFLLFGRLIDTVNAVRAETPRLVTAGIAALFGFEFGWSVLANLGWAPMPTNGINFPLLSFGGTLLLVHAAAIGLVLGAYRRRTLATV